MYNKSNRGPNTDPCVTPCLIILISDSTIYRYYLFPITYILSIILTSPFIDPLIP